VTVANWSSASQFCTLLAITKGLGAPETLKAYERITELAEKSGNLAPLSLSSYMRGSSALIAGDFSTAGALADQALKVAQAEGNPKNLAVQY
jgi:hypothetical protein